MHASRREGYGIWLTALSLLMVSMTFFMPRRAFLDTAWSACTKGPTHSSASDVRIQPFKHNT